MLPRPRLPGPHFPAPASALLLPPGALTSFAARSRTQPLPAPPRPAPWPLSQVRFAEECSSFLTFITSACAIVGGVFTVSGRLGGQWACGWVGLWPGGWLGEWERAQRAGRPARTACGAERLAAPLLLFPPLRDGCRMLIPGVHQLPAWQTAWLLCW